jgi:hypothetical protein
MKPNWTVDNEVSNTCVGSTARGVRKSGKYKFYIEK